MSAVKDTKMKQAHEGPRAHGGTRAGRWRGVRVLDPGGTGTGSAATGTTAAITVNQTSTVTAMGPGVAAQALSGNFDNPNSGPVYVTTVTAAIGTVTGGPTCEATDYTLTNPVSDVNAQVPAGNGVGSWGATDTPTIAFNNKAAENQDDCKNATVQILYTASLSQSTDDARRPGIRAASQARTGEDMARTRRTRGLVVGLLSACRWLLLGALPALTWRLARRRTCTRARTAGRTGPREPTWSVPCASPGRSTAPLSARRRQRRST